MCVSYRVELLHLLPQHARDHPDEAPVFELTRLLIKFGQQRSHRGAFTVQTGVPVHSPVRKTNAQRLMRDVCLNIQKYTGNNYPKR